MLAPAKAMTEAEKAEALTELFALHPPALHETVRYVGGTVAPGTPPLGQPPGLTVSPRVGTVHAGVSRPRVGREAPGWGGPSWREPPRGGA